MYCQTLSAMSALSTSSRSLQKLQCKLPSPTGSMVILGQMQFCHTWWLGPAPVPPLASRPRSGVCKLVDITGALPNKRLQITLFPPAAPPKLAAGSTLRRSLTVVPTLRICSRITQYKSLSQHSPHRAHAMQASRLQLADLSQQSTHRAHAMRALGLQHASKL